MRKGLCSWWMLGVMLLIPSVRAQSTPKPTTKVALWPGAGGVYTSAYLACQDNVKTWRGTLTSMDYYPNGIGPTGPHGVKCNMINGVLGTKYDVVRPECNDIDYSYSGGIEGVCVLSYLFRGTGKDLGQQCRTGDKGNQAGDAAGNPLTIATGNKYEKVVDFETASPRRLAFERHYNSRGGRFDSWMLGQGWRSNWERIVISNTPDLIAHRADGQVIPFAPMSPGSNTFREFNNTSSAYTLIRTDTSYVLTDSNDTVETYERPTGRLVSVKERNGYTQMLTYGTDTKLQKVTDSYGRSLQFTYAGGYLATMTDSDGKVYQYTFEIIPLDASYIKYQSTLNKRLRSVTYPDGTSVSYAYEKARFPLHVTGITDERGVRFATFTYDERGRALSSEHNGGVGKVTLAYDDVTGKRTVTNSLGKKTTYAPTTSYTGGYVRMKTVTGEPSSNCEGANQRYGYDESGFSVNGKPMPVRVTGWNGNVTTYVYNARGLQTKRTEAVGKLEARTVTTEWHATYRLPVKITEPRREITFTYDANGWLINRTEKDTSLGLTNGQVRTWSYTYTAKGELASVDGPRSDVPDTTTFAYDAMGNRQTITNALGHITTVNTFNGRGLPTQITDANGVVTVMTYNERGWLTSVKVDNAATTTFSYLPSGEISRVTLPNGSYLQYGYDNARRLTSVSNNSGEQIAYTLNALGNITKREVRNSSGGIVKMQTATFDELGRLLQNIGAVGQTTKYTWDKNNNVKTVTDALGDVTTNAYDALDRLITVTDALGGVVTRGYDSQGNLISVKDAKNITTSFVYNGFGEVISESSPDTGTTTFVRDSAGNITQRTDARGVVTNTTYDALNRVKTVVYPANVAENVTYTYDSMASGNKGVGRLTAVADESGTQNFLALHNGSMN
ncbi:hypothetical protein IJ00_26700 (plasmid) [Calothrix sp. 336/3]|nr:hypothetical protein IJ00_26700 [Calothrix sp. 336/3]